MKYRVMLFTSLLLSVIIVTGCTGKGPTSHDARNAIDNLLKMQEDAYDLHNEKGRQIMAQTCEDSILFVGGDDGGLSQSSASYVNDLADGYSQRPSGRTYRIYDHTAIVSAVQQTFKVFGKDTIYFNARSTKVFVKENDSWKMAYVSYAPLPVLYYQPGNVNRSGFADFAGLYIGPTERPDTVLTEKGKLFIAAAGAGRSELLPLNDSTFYGNGYFGFTVFSRNHEGRVSEMYYEYPDGQRIHFSKQK